MWLWQQSWFPCWSWSWLSYWLCAVLATGRTGIHLLSSCLCVCLFLGGWVFFFCFFFALLTLLVSGRKKTSEGTYDLPHLDSTGTSSPCRTAQFAWMCFVDLLLHLCASVADWWKSMKQLLPSKMVETEDSVRYSSSEVSRLTGRGVVPGLHAEPAGKCCRLQ